MQDSNDTELVFRVIRKQGRRLTSLLTNPPLLTSLAPGQWGKARVGPLFAYRDEPTALHIAKLRATLSIVHVQVWVCEARTVTRIPERMPFFPAHTTYSEGAWDEPTTLERLHDFWAWWPDGTPPDPSAASRLYSPEIVLCAALRPDTLIKDYPL